MRKYNALQALYLSFYSKSLYRDVAINWGAYAFLYLLMLIALSWIWFTYLLQHNLNIAYAKNSDQIVNQIPVITIKDGKINTPLNQPYLITDPEKKNVIAIIDTSGKYTNLENAKTGILITQTQIFTQTKPNEVRVDQLPKNLNLVVKPTTVNSYIQQYLGFVWILFFIIAVLGAYIYRILQALLYAIIGKIASLVFNVQISYGQILQIMMVAITPVIILATIFDIFDIVFKNQILIYFVIAMVYLFFGIIANKKPEQT